MPELPEVETVRKGLIKLLKDFKISNVEILRDSSVSNTVKKIDFVRGLSGSRITNWDRRGKYLIGRLTKTIESNEKLNHKIISKSSLVIHLRMTGYFEFLTKNKPACKHTRIRIFDTLGRELRFIDIRSFGQMWWLPEGEKPEEKINGIKTLGPEPFSERFNSKYLKEIFNNKTRAIKSTLLDQKVIAGIGNIYADESLFLAGINPSRATGKLTDNEIISLQKSIVITLRKSIKKGGTSFSDFRDLTGINGNYGDQAWVYRRGTKKCRKCGDIIEKIKLAGRSTHWCPTCQQ